MAAARPSHALRAASRVRPSRPHGKKKCQLPPRARYPAAGSSASHTLPTMATKEKFARKSKRNQRPHINQPSFLFLFPDPLSPVQLSLLARAGGKKFLQHNIVRPAGLKRMQTRRASRRNPSECPRCCLSSAMCKRMLAQAALPPLSVLSGRNAMPGLWFRALDSALTFFARQQPPIGRAARYSQSPPAVGRASITLSPSPPRCRPCLDNPRSMFTSARCLRTDTLCPATSLPGALFSILHPVA